MTQISRLAGIGDGNSIDWNDIIKTGIQTIPTLFNHGNTVNKETTPGVMNMPAQSNLPASAYSNAANNYPAQPQTSSNGLSTTSILLLAGAGLVAFKMLKKK